ncbi:MAG: UbiA family prenyltransferase, partial [Phycisphaeraceae bacterium]|nr:UbiA family prenyltransferase [Phycisphaeraceae bacterium]
MPAMTTIPQPTTGQDRSLLTSMAALARDIKLSHSVFALPFALLATFLAASHRGRLPGVLELTLLVVCMVLARTLAMSVNRWADAGLDAQNPRTARRAIPAGRLSRSFVLGAAVVCFAGFVLAAGGFWLVNGNPWPVVLSPLVGGWLALYSFTKRYTWLCHLFLGSSLALSPIAATIAIDP